MPNSLLAPLPYEEWTPTLTTLHLWCQIVGKLRLGHVPYRSHWWNVTLLPTARGLSTGRMRAGTTFFQIDFDFVDHEVVVQSNRAHEPASIPLRDGLSVAEFYATLFQTLAAFGIQTRIVDKPYGMGVDIPFSVDRDHASYDRVMVRRWWEIILWSADVFDQYASEFIGKESPAHVFWHSFDLAIARYSGRPANKPPSENPVEQEAYSQEVISVGFWAGDPNTPAPTYYTYTAPEPASLTSMPLAPVQAAWSASGSGHLGVLPYDAVRTAADPRATLLEFMHSGFNAGTKAANWPDFPKHLASCDALYRADAK
ncbi:MAG: DUF5996 family protein [Candidatus Aquilonibacter sp.]